MMKKILTLMNAIVLSFIFSLPAWALSLNYSSQDEVINFDYRPLIDPQKNEINKNNSSLSGKGLPSIPTVISTDFSEVIASIGVDSSKNIIAGGGSEIQNSGPEPVPEPATLVLLGSGLIGITFLGRRQKRSSK